MLALLIASAGGDRVVFGVVMACGCLRLAVTGLYELTGSSGLELAAGITGLLLAGACAHRAGEPLTLDAATVTELNDQHAFVTTEPAGALRPGDLLRLGISHPCGAFARWRTLLELAPDYTVPRAIRTFF